MIANVLPHSLPLHLNLAVGSPPRWAQALSLGLNQTAVVALPGFFGDLSSWYNTPVDSDLRTPFFGPVRKEQSAREAREVEMNPPAVKAEDGEDCLLPSVGRVGSPCDFGGIYGSSHSMLAVGPHMSFPGC